MSGKATRTQNYDADGNGELSELEEVCAKYDTNGDGTFSILEVQAVVRDMEQAKKDARNMGRLAAGVLVVAICLCGVLVALMIGANEASKESHVNSGILVDLNGNPTQTKELTSVAALSDLPKLSSDQLRTIKFIGFDAWKKTGTSGQELDFETSKTENGGTFSLHLDVKGFIKSSKDVTFNHISGTITIPLNISIAPVCVLDGEKYVIIGEQQAGGRKLAESNDVKPRFYSSIEKFKAANNNNRVSGRVLMGKEEYWNPASAGDGPTSVSPFFGGAFMPNAGSWASAGTTQKFSSSWASAASPFDKLGYSRN